MRRFIFHLAAMLCVWVLLPENAGAASNQEKEPAPPPPAVAPEGMRRFSFGPAEFKGLEGQPNFREGFTLVNVSSDYSKERGFGWIGAEGEVTREWTENRGKLHSRARRGPNDLLAGWVAGGLPFSVDVPNGKYVVTACLGDWGEYEFFPFGSFTLLYQGREVFKSVRNKDNWDQWILKHKYDDYERGRQLYDRYVKTRFDVVTGEVEAADGKIMVQARVDAGPETYTGALNYLVISPAAQKDAHEKYLAALEALLSHNFDKRFPQAPVSNAYVDGAAAEEAAAGFAIFRRQAPKIDPGSFCGRADRITELLAYGAPDQTEPVEFEVMPLKAVGSLTCVCSGLEGPQGAKIPAAEIKVGYVKYWDYYDRKARPPQVTVEPYLIMDRNVIAKTEDHVTRQWWLTVHVPENAAGGVYKGAVTVAAEKGGSLRLPLVFNVLPLKLDPPGAVLLLNYSFPWKAVYFGDDNARWADIEKELRLQRDYGMNSTAVEGCHLPINDDDTAEWEKFIGLYQKVGFAQPIYFGGTMNLYAKFKNLLDPAQQDEYCAVFRKLDAAAKKLNQKVIYSVSDEGTNDGLEARSELAAKIVHDKAPDILIIGDINGYRELMHSAPYLHAAGFNNGWQGSYGTNRLNHNLITRTVIERVKAAGCEPWFVNGGVGRYPFGAFFWKMQALGVKGKCEWHFYSATSDPYNPFDGNEFNAFGSLVFPSCIPTMSLEESREGIYDLRYVRTLERVAAEKIKDPDPLVAARAQAAKEALDYWIDQLPDRMVTAQTSDGAVQGSGADFPPARLADFRKEIAWHLCRLLKLECPAVYTPETMLASWEKDENTGWTSAIKPVAEHATHGGQAGKLVFNKQHTYFDSWGRLRTKDWRGYTSFRFDMFNPQEKEVSLVLTVRDQLAANISAESSARKTVVFQLKPGANQLAIPLIGLTDDSGKRPLDLSCVFNLFFTVKDAPEETELFVDNMRLLQDQ